MTESTNLTVSRRYLLLATSTVTAVGTAAAAVPFVRSWNPSAKARALGAPIKVDIAKLQPGELLGPVPAWRGQPIFVLHRTEEVIARLNEQNRNLADAYSKKSEQPDYAANSTRSIRPEIGVYVGLCTHLGCSPKYYGEVRPQKFATNWQGGFFCPCHGSRFDLAGRVEKNLPAPTNLPVPPYQFIAETIVLIGDDTQAS
ncbi:MAG: ubiquinol-cytochrome c reductase iron-sulfur subunit [Gammaproteobacteria bacterium]|nr:ubiquinol-cytochrome c reductase iron-sulfur subunit [Gammaproteobacteria bacterium]MDE0645827.1 ubiquinol-cytochrome c reductase iron-sulfur subunit [Gammaproteobacteria bacterium]MXX94733.1 ubiquinol-cytochrome c reductase iron-sulfur subunit [Gammaproteobacteria bacterium]MYF54149.1 ubiquinol-cytochrome c reductase iron-sulfur subunit [Gammaproteobacteria bacterium]MYK43860.1 ubiquinol-cytochrome c reductase iron-sulfur subunit [Gammaproteobacteria bacterium]